MAKPYQIAAIPIRRRAAGGLEVLLVTSRETRRWVVPKGWPWREAEDYDTAAGEAWEEAGVKGTAGRRMVGTFTYPKFRNGKCKILNVRVYLLEVSEEAPTWPEVAERTREWFTPERAAELVLEPGLKELLQGLSQQSEREVLQEIHDVKP